MNRPTSFAIAAGTFGLCSHMGSAPPASLVVAIDHSIIMLAGLYSTRSMLA